MSRRIRWALAVLGLVPGCAWFAPPPAWELPAPPAPEAPVVQPGSLERARLENGLEILVLEDHRLPRVSVGITLRRGSGIVDPAQAGLASFTAELMKRGAGDRDAFEFAKAVDEIGAHLNVASSWDSTGVAISGLSRDLDRLIELLSDVALRPRFDSAEAAKALAEQLAGLEQAVDDPSTLARWYAARALYPGHRYGLPQVGTRETVHSLSAEDARKLHERIFSANNAILFASGDVRAEDLIERARAAFSSWPAGPVLAPAPEPPFPAPPERRVVIVDRPDIAQSHIMMVHEGIRRVDERRIAANLMNDVLGGSGFSSRLTARLRAQAGLTYGVWSGFSLRRHPGPFIVSMSTRVAETRRAIDLLLEVIDDMRGDGSLTADELARAKSLAVGRFGLSLETSGAVLSGLVGLDVYGLPSDSLDTYRSRVRGVSLEDAASTARELLHPDRSAIVVVGPAADLEPLLAGLGPVEVVQP